MWHIKLAIAICAIVINGTRPNIPIIQAQLLRNNLIFYCYNRLSKKRTTFPFHKHHLRVVPSTDGPMTRILICKVIWDTVHNDDYTYFNKLQICQNMQLFHIYIIII